MKKFFLIVILLSLLLFGCSKYVFEPNDVIINESNAHPNYCGDSAIITTVDELKTLAGSSSDVWGYYESVIAFLTNDAEAMAEWGKYNVEDRFSKTDYQTITEMKISSFQVTELENYDLDFKFTISESKNDLFPTGDYHFKISMMWFNMNEYSYDSKYDELVDLIDVLAAHGCTAWEDGELTYDDNGLGFDFCVFRTIQWYVTYNDSVKFNGTPESYAEYADKLFGIENFVPQSEYIELVDGKWDYNTYINRISIRKSITDIRQMGNKIEIDIQYYADKYGMIPAHSVTVFVTETKDAEYKYFFEKAVVTEIGEHKPLRWSV